MKSKSLLVPSDILHDQNLNLHQKLILSLLSTVPKMFALNIAKGLGTRRSSIRDDLEALVNQERLVTTNGGKRIAYSKSKSFDLLLDSSSVEPLKKAIITSERSEEVIKTKERKENKRKENTKRKEKKEKKESHHLKLFPDLDDKVNCAFDYWVERGGRKHREGTDVLKNSFDLLGQVFSGTAFTNIPDSVLPSPKLNKTKIFDLEDWKTSIDNYILSLTSHAHYPESKASAIAYRKKRLNLNGYIYNAFAKEGNTRSFFLKYLEPPNLIHTEVSIYKKLNRQLTKAFDRITLHQPPTPAQIISASNRYGKIIAKYQMRGAVADLATLFTDFIKEHWDERKFNPNWMVSDWWDDKLIRWLHKKGLICY